VSLEVAAKVTAAGSLEVTMEAEEETVGAGAIVAIQ